MGASLRYLDSFVKIGAPGCSASASSYVDWTETKAVPALARAHARRESALQRLLPISVHPRRQAPHGAMPSEAWIPPG